VNRVPKHRRFVGRARRSVQMHQETERGVVSQVFAPTNDELLRAGVEVALVERRRVDGVEQLPQLRDVHLDDATISGEDIPGGSWLGRPKIRPGGTRPLISGAHALIRGIEHEGSHSHGVLYGNETASGVALNRIEIRVKGS
jgi:hypothetical protein